MTFACNKQEERHRDKNACAHYMIDVQSVTDGISERVKSDDNGAI